jgi:hypothetical protein
MLAINRSPHFHLKESEEVFASAYIIDDAEAQAKIQASIELGAAMLAAIPGVCIIKSGDRISSATSNLPF